MCVHFHNISVQLVVMRIISFVTVALYGRMVLAGVSGMDKGGPSDRILHGSNALIEQFPFMALTIPSLIGSGKIKTLCGGALISERWVISAAHCVHKSKEPYIVTLGTADLVDTSGGITFLVPKCCVFPHPNFRISNSSSPDVLLYKLPTAVKFANYPKIKTISLANKPKDSVCHYDDKRVITLGWGITENGTNSRTLKYTNLKVYPNAKCRVKHPEINNALMCTEKLSQYSGPCPGDSGGPLVAKGCKGDFELVGITSHAMTQDPCFDPFSIDVYTYLPYHKDWIQKTIRANYHN